MLIRVGYDISFECPAPTPMVLALYIHPSRFNSVVKPESLRVEPNVPVKTFFDTYGNMCGRMVAPTGIIRFINDATVQDSGLPDETPPENVVQHAVQDLPDEVMQFLLSSRYCEVDLLQDIAWGLFSKVPEGWARAKAICTWAHERIKFNYMDASSTRSAMGGYNDCKGVCRDYMHLAITLSRCMNIPARYATGYLGDIGIPPDPVPMDFSAWYEVYLGGRWWTMDARHNVPRIGRVLMARGRDAVDVALTTAFGVAKLKEFKVWTDEVK
jgi:transglutaminase-like putative cysteine protease